MMMRPGVAFAVGIIMSVLLVALVPTVPAQGEGPDTSGSLEPVPVSEPTDLRQATGKLTLLRVHDVGTGFGPPADFIDVEVVIQLDSQPGKAFGFQLRDDGNRPARQGMLDLLRDAFRSNWTVTIDYEIDPGKNNGIIRRVWLTK